MPAAVISTCSCLMSPPLLFWICPLCRPFIKWPNVCFLALWHRWHRSGSADPLSEMFTVIVLGYLQQAHCPIHFLVQKNNKQTAKRIAAKSGKRLTVTVGSNHPGSSSNSPLLSPSHLSYPPISASFSTYLTNLCVLVCAWPCNACAFCDCEPVGARRSCCVSSVCRCPHVAADAFGRFGQGSDTFYLYLWKIAEKKTLHVLQVKGHTLSNSLKKFLNDQTPNCIKSVISYW